MAGGPTAQRECHDDLARHGAERRTAASDGQDWARKPLQLRPLWLESRPDNPPHTGHSRFPDTVRRFSGFNPNCIAIP